METSSIGELATWVVGKFEKLVGVSRLSFIDIGKYTYGIYDQCLYALLVVSGASANASQTKKPLSTINSNVNIGGNVLLRRVKLEGLLTPVMDSPTKNVGALAAPKATKWDVALVVSDCKKADSGRFFRSVQDYVDDADKKSDFALMLTTLFSAIESDNYQDVIKGTSVTCKKAHSFNHNKSNHILWELKHGKKNRIYFWTIKAKGRNKGIIILSMAFHKKDQETPVEVTGPCEKEMRNFLANDTVVEFCSEKDHGKQK